MSLWRRSWRVLLLLVAIILLVTAVSFVKGFDLAVTDQSGVPLTNVFVVYSYHGYSFGIGHPGEHYRPGSIRQTDANGRLQIPSKVFFHLPLLDYQEELRIHAIWSPKLHSNGHIWSNLAKPEVADGVYEFLPEQRKLILHDISTNHLAWFFTVDELASLSREFDVAPEQFSISPAMKATFRAAIDEDERQFKAKHYTNVFESRFHPGTGDGRNGKTYGRLLERGIF